MSTYPQREGPTNCFCPQCSDTQRTQAHPQISYPTEQPDPKHFSVRRRYDADTSALKGQSKNEVEPYANHQHQYAGSHVETAMIVPDISSREELGVPGRPQTDVSQWLSFVYTSLRH